MYIQNSIASIGCIGNHFYVHVCHRSNSRGNAVAPPSLWRAITDVDRAEEEPCGSVEGRWPNTAKWTWFLNQEKALRSYPQGRLCQTERQSMRNGHASIQFYSSCTIWRCTRATKSLVPRNHSAWVKFWVSEKLPQNSLGVQDICHHHSSSPISKFMENFRLPPHARPPHQRLSPPLWPFGAPGQ